MTKACKQSKIQQERLRNAPVVRQQLRDMADGRVRGHQTLRPVVGRDCTKWLPTVEH
jgi:hypothetical protein